MDEKWLPTYKILVMGMSGAGKTTFLAALSEISIILVDKLGPAANNNYQYPNLEFGRLGFLDEENQKRLLYLFGTRHNQKFDFMWEIFAEGFLGIIFMIDSTTTETFPQAQAELLRLDKYRRFPIVIAANKQDKDSAWSAEDLRTVLSIPSEIPIISSVATNPQSVSATVIRLCEAYLASYEIPLELINEVDLPKPQPKGSWRFK